MRRATGDQSGVTTDEPAMPGMRRPSASRSAARTIILEGMHHSRGTAAHQLGLDIHHLEARLRQLPGDLLSPWTEADDDRIDLRRSYRLAQFVTWTGATMGEPTSSWIW